MNKPVLDMGAFLAASGSEFLGLDSDGSPLVKSKDGKEGVLDVRAMFKAQGINPLDVDVEWNTPKNPVDTSIVPLSDRINLGMGNTRGQLEYLKKSFDDSAYSDEHGLMVKSKGVWSKVDSSSMDPWELTKDIAESVVPLAASVAASTVGAVKGAAAGAIAGPVGAAVGGIAGAGVGGGAAEGMRIVMGRALGTYNGNADEVQKDIMWETFLNMGGQAVALGAKPTFKMIANAAKSIKNQAAPATKEVVSVIYGATTGAGTTLTRALIENPDEVAKTAHLSLIKNSFDSSAVKADLAKKNVDTMKGLIKDGKPALSKAYMELKDKFLETVPADFKANIREPIFETMSELQRQGFGKFMVKNTAIDDVASKQLSKLKLGDLSFKMSSPEDINKIVASGRFPDRLSTETVDAIRGYVDEMNKWLYAGDHLRGKAAADAALTVKKSLSDIAFSIKEKATSKVGAKVTEFSVMLDDSLARNFAEKNINESFQAMNSLYANKISMIDDLQSVIARDATTETFVNKLMTAPGKSGTAKGYAQELAELIGGDAPDRLKSIIVNESAAAFSSFAPSFSKLAPMLGATAGSAAVATGTMAAPVAVAIGSQASPRVVMGQFKAAKKVFDYGSVLREHIQSMSPELRMEWLRKPEAVNAVFRTVLEAYDSEDSQVKAVLERTGVIPPGGQSHGP